MIEAEFLEMLRCPESQQPLASADASLLQSLNQKVAAGALRNRAGDKIEEPFQEGLVRQDKKVFYPIRQNIPVMLIAESVSL